MKAIAKETKGHDRGPLLELLFANVAEAIFLAEADGRIIDANPTACAMLGYGEDEILEMYLWDFLTRVTRDEILALIGGMKGGAPVTVQQTYRRKTGEIRTMDVRLTRFGPRDRELIAASCRDLSERRCVEERTADLERTNLALQAEIEEHKRAEEALQHSEDYLRLAIDTIPGLVWTSLPDGNIEYLNKRWLEYTGMRQEDAIGWGWQAAIHPQDLSGLVEYWKSIFTAGEAGEYEARLRRFDGEYRWFLFKGVPLHDEQGKVVKWYGTNTDIEAMRVSEHLARGQLEALSQTLTALSRESEPEKFLEHILRTIGRQLKAHSIGVWDMNQSTGRTELIANCENDRLHLATPQENQASRVATPPRDHPIWTEFFRSGEQFVFGEIDTEPHRECVSPTGRILHGTIGWEMPWIIRM